MVHAGWRACVFGWLLRGCSAACVGLGARVDRDCSVVVSRPTPRARMRAEPRGVLICPNPRKRVPFYIIAQYKILC